MQGFSDKALVLFPKDENYRNKEDFWKRHFSQSLTSLIKFLREKEIETHISVCDEVGIQMDREGITYINAIPPEDLNFMKKNVKGLTILPNSVDIDEELYDYAREKFPIKPGLSRHDRLDILIKRHKLLTKKLIEDYKIVISFENQSSKQFDPKTKLKKDRIVMVVDHKTFFVTTFYNGEQMFTKDILGDDRCSSQLYNWR